MKFLTPHCISTIHDDQQLGRKCYRITLRRADDEGTSKESQPKQKVLSIQGREINIEIQACEGETLDDQTELIRIGDAENQQILIGKSLPRVVRVKLWCLLQEYLDVFAWSSKYLVGIPRENVTHKLNISPKI